jgi:5-methylcytosine-specific restriction endonuclease McrA
MNKSSKNKKNRKKYLLHMQRYHCYYCGCSLNFKTATLDHVVPKSKGGGATRENQVATCAPCNRRKGNGSAHVLVAMAMQGLAA